VLLRRYLRGMETLTVNLIGRRRRVERDGREYLVAPATLIVPGVLNGSSGPILYTSEENRASEAKWRGVDLLWNHPYENGKPVSARNNESIVNKYGLGFVDNPDTDEAGVLNAEAWFDIEKTKNVNPEVLNKLELNEPMELSTGLSMDREKVVGNKQVQGKPYHSVARNYQPDHLAVFTDQVGACSLHDGCGIHNAEGEPVRNELSHNDLYSALSTKVQERFGDEAWIVEVFDTSLIYSMAGAMYRLNYTTDLRTTDGTVTLSNDSPTEVQRVSRFVPVKNEENAMNEEQRSAMIGELISNCGCWSEADRETLNKFSDDKITELHGHSKTVAENEAIANAARNSEDIEITDNGLQVKAPSTPKTPTKTTSETTNNSSSQEVSPEEWLDKAPAQIRSAVQNAMRIEENERQKLIDELTANLSGDTAKGEAKKALNLKSLEDLQLMKSLLPEKKVVNESSASGSRLARYFGQAPSEPPTTNSKREFEPLVPPVMDFSNNS